MDNPNRRKAELLGMPFGTATARLRKTLLFTMAQRLGEDVCYRCGNVIESESEFSIEHKTAWASAKNPVEMFFSLDNISFSHINCNIGARKQVKIYSTPEDRARAKLDREYSDPVRYKAHLEAKRRNYHERKDR